MATTTTTGDNIRQGDIILDGRRRATVARLGQPTLKAYADGPHLVIPALLVAGGRKYVHNIDTTATYEVERISAAAPAAPAPAGASLVRVDGSGLRGPGPVLARLVAQAPV